MGTAKLREYQRLRGTVALITGASSGIGKAIAETLAGEGASVVILGRRADRVGAIADRINHSGGSALALPVDISKREHADIVRYIVTQPPHVSINELLVRPTEQSFAPTTNPLRPPGSGDTATLREP